MPVARAGKKTYNNAFAAGHGAAGAISRGGKGGALQPEVTIRANRVDTEHGEQPEEGFA